jgi:hypothetical protein
MTIASAPATPGRSRGWPGLATARLLRLEFRRNAMMWLVPVGAGLFWYDAYRQSVALPPLWNVRAMSMQTSALLDFVPPVVGAAAWMGSREGRRHTADLVEITARPRWARQLAAWAATTCWAMAGYLGCVAVLYGVTAHQAAWGGPLWWPVAVGAAGVPALSALGFAVGALLPGRFTAPLVTVAAFFGLGFSTVIPHGGRWYGLISPIIPSTANIGPDTGVATFFPYLPDLSIAQTMFLAGFTMTALGIMGLPGGSGARWLRRCAAAITAAGVLAAGTASGLAGTARQDRHGMTVIAALHDAASDKPVTYTPVCGRGPIPVCLNPAYRAYLPAVASGLTPVLSEVAGLPGAPVRATQAAPVYQQRRDGVSVGMPGPPVSGNPPAFRFIIPGQLPGEWVNGGPVTSVQFTDRMRWQAAVSVVTSVIYGRDTRRTGAGGRGRPTQAERAVVAALLRVTGAARIACLGGDCPEQPPGLAPRPGTAEFAAARRFAMLPDSVRHAWLVTHLAALQAGRITVAQLP